MGGFDDYLKENRQQAEQKSEIEVQEELNTAFIDYQENIYTKQKEAGLGDDAEAPTDTASYAKERLRVKREQSTFAERSEYYFKDAKAEADLKQNKAFDEKSYELFKKQYEASRILACPQYRADYERIFTKFPTLKSVPNVKR